jgi:hypothetical protein
MPMTVRLQTENGCVLKEIHDLDDALVRLAQHEDASQLAIAHTIDPYGDTYFNYLQVPLLLQDLDRINASDLSQSETEIVGQIADLARQSLAERHLYVRFVGD